MARILRPISVELSNAGRPRTTAPLIVRYENDDDPDPTATYSRVTANLTMRNRTDE